MKCEQCSRTTIGTPSKNPRTKRLISTKSLNELEDGPDGTTAWCVAFSAFLINFIMAGLSRMSGILFVAFIEMFHTDRKGASMPFSTRSSTMNLLGPVVGILGQLYGVRIVSIFGGVLGTLSSAACFFVDDITGITLLWGGVNGVGTALVTTLTTVIVDQYFDKHKTTASGMSFSGACIGSFIFPPLVENLLHVYGLEGSFLIIAGVIMHTIPAAMILRKPTWVKLVKSKAINNLETSNMEKGKNNSDRKLCLTGANVDLDCLRTNSNLVLELLSTDLIKDENVKKSYPQKDEILREMEDMYSFVGKTPVSLTLSDVPPKMRLKLECETSPVSSRSRSFRTVGELYRSELKSPTRTIGRFQIYENLSTQVQCKPFILSKLNELYDTNENMIISSFSNKNLYSKVLKELRKLHKVYETMRKRNIFARTRQNSKIIKASTFQTVCISKSSESSESNGLWGNIRNSIRIHTNPLFLLISLCRAVHFTTFIPVVTIIVDYAIDKGFKESDGKYVIAALSVGDLLGRLCLGWVTDKGFVSLPKYMLVVMIFQGLGTASLPLMNTMTTLLPIVAIYAMLQGSVFVRHTVLISKYMKSDEQSIASGCVNFFAGLLGFAVPNYVGFFRDKIGSYDGIFYVNGIVGATTGLVWIFEPYFVKMVSTSAKVTLNQSSEIV